MPNLFVLPFGTALGIYAFWVLLHDESRRMFVEAPRSCERRLRSSHDWKKPSLGLDANVAAALAYVLGWISGVVLLLTERQNRFVRFHALQSISSSGPVRRSGSSVPVDPAARLADLVHPHPAALGGALAAADVQGLSGRALQAAVSATSPNSAPEPARVRPSESRPDKIALVAITEAAVLEALTAVRDPDLNRDIVSLKFIKNLRIDGGRVAFSIELTTPACPVKDQMRDQARDRGEPRFPA